MSKGITNLQVKKPDTLIQFLLDKMGGMSRTSVKQMLSLREVSVNGTVQTRHDYALNEGDKVTIQPQKAANEFRHPKLKIIYEDENLVVVEKKNGLLTVATNEASREVTCLSLLKNYYKQRSSRSGVYVVHRLDRETSGVLVFAKTQELQHYMRDYWREIVKERTYIAVAEGEMPEKEGTITTWLTEDKKNAVVYSSPYDDGGKIAVTHYKTLRSNGSYSLLQLNLETGRTNQIRVHLASKGHPVVGDRKYGHAATATPAIDRLALHAQTLSFIHLVTEQVVRFESAVPKEFNKVFTVRT